MLLVEPIDRYFDEKIEPLRDEHLGRHFSSMKHLWIQKNWAHWCSQNNILDQRRPKSRLLSLPDIAVEEALEFCNVIVARHGADISHEPPLNIHDHKVQRFVMAQALSMIGAQIFANHEIEKLLQNPPSKHLWDRVRGKLPGAVRLRLKAIMKAQTLDELYEERNLTARYCDKVSLVSLFSDDIARDFFAINHYRDRRIDAYVHHAKQVRQISIIELNDHMRTQIKLGQKLAKCFMAAQQPAVKHKRRRRNGQCPTP